MLIYSAWLDINILVHVFIDIHTLHMQARTHLHRLTSSLLLTNAIRTQISYAGSLILKWRTKIRMQMIIDGLYHVEFDSKENLWIINAKF